MGNSLWCIFHFCSKLKWQAFVLTLWFSFYVKVIVFAHVWFIFAYCVCVIYIVIIIFVSSLIWMFVEGSFAHANRKTVWTYSSASHINNYFFKYSYLSKVKRILMLCILPLTSFEVSRSYVQFLTLTWYIVAHTNKNIVRFAYDLIIIRNASWLHIHS